MGRVAKLESAAGGRCRVTKSRRGAWRAPSDEKLTALSDAKGSLTCQVSRLMCQGSHLCAPIARGASRRHHLTPGSVERPPLFPAPSGAVLVCAPPPPCTLWTVAEVAHLPRWFSCRVLECARGEAGRGAMWVHPLALRHARQRPFHALVRRRELVALHAGGGALVDLERGGLGADDAPPPQRAVRAPHLEPRRVRQVTRELALRASRPALALVGHFAKSPACGRRCAHTHV